VTHLPVRYQGRIQDLKKLRRAEGGAKIFWVFRVKNHDFTPKNHIFSIAEGGAKIFEVFRVKNHDFTPKNHTFSNYRGRVRPPPPESAPGYEHFASIINALCGEIHWDGTEE
jgi:hypothetical protein